MLLFLARLVHLACKCARLQKSLSPGFIARCGACPKLLPPLPQATYVASDITYIFVFFYFCVEAHLKCKTFETISTTAAAAAAISWSKLEAVVVVRSYFLTPLEIRANVNEPNPHPPTPPRGHDVACVWRVWRSTRIGGWSLFVFCSLCVRVLKLNCFTRARRNSTFHSSLSFHSSLPLSLSLSLPHLLYQFPVPVEATNVSAICVGANSLVIVICVSLLLRKSWSSRKGEGEKRFFFVETTRSHRLLPHLVWAERDATQCYKFQRYSRFTVSASVCSSPISDILTSCQTIWWARVEFNYVTYIVERRAIKAINPSNAPYRLHEPPTRLDSSCLAPTDPIEIWWYV